MAALQWAGLVARNEAVEGILEDIPGPEADAVLARSVPTPADAQAATVVEIVDGDTLVLTAEPGAALAGGETRARLLLVDSPEVDGPATTQECYGPEAGEFLAGLVPPGSGLRVTLDTEPQDRFGRTLVYAWREDGIFVNETIARNGAGYAGFIAPNDEHLDPILTAEDLARAERRGVWGAC